MQIIVHSQDELKKSWNGLQNFLIDPEYFRFDMEFPSAEEIVDILRKDSQARVNIPGELSEEEKKKGLRNSKRFPSPTSSTVPFRWPTFTCRTSTERVSFCVNFRTRS